MEEFNFNVEDDVQVYDEYPIIPSSIRVEDGSLENQYTYRGNSLDPNASLTDISIQSVSRYADDDYFTVQGSELGYKAEKLKIYNGTNIEDFNTFIKYAPLNNVYRPGIVTSTLDNVTTTTTYDYYTDDRILSPSSISSTNSDGEVFRKDFYYTVDYPDAGIRAKLQAAHHIGIPYKTEIYNDGARMDGQETTYNYFNSLDFPKPQVNRRYTRTWEDGVLQPGAWTIQSSITAYDANNGLVKSVQQDGWADAETIEYNDNKLPIKKSYLGHEVITTYYLNSSMVQSMTAVDGTTTDYNYDDLMRLKNTSNCKGATISYLYHFADIGDGDFDYVQTTKDYTSATDNSNPNSEISIINSRTYKDGLGRAIETVLMNQAPAPNENDDIILAVEYDNQGRAYRQYEAQTASNNAGNYVFPNSGWASSTTEFYPSPLNRPEQTTAPDWDYPTQYIYGSNTVGDNVLINGSQFAVYPSNTLYKKITIDGNENKSISFIDIKGRTILARQTVGSESSLDNHDTYIIYDDKNRKESVLPPGTTLTDNDLIYQYEYDGEDKMTKKKVPGRVETLFKYNRRDLLASLSRWLLGKPNWNTMVCIQL